MWLHRLYPKNMPPDQHRYHVCDVCSNACECFVHMVRVRRKEISPKASSQGTVGNQSDTWKEGMKTRFNSDVK